MKTDVDYARGLVDRYRSLQEELASLVGYINETRETLGGLHHALPAASDALSAVTETTEKATHNILALVEELLGEDERGSAALEVLQAAFGESEDAGVRAALDSLVQSGDRRSMMLTEMMTELSFQDLTCQTINRISKSIVEIERRIMRLIDTEALPHHVGPEGGHSGLERLKETQGGASRQDMVDALLGSRG